LASVRRVGKKDSLGKGLTSRSEKQRREPSTKPWTGGEDITRGTWKMNTLVYHGNSGSPEEQEQLVCRVCQSPGIRLDIPAPFEIMLYVALANKM
jgi:hypothetical protein